MTVKLLFCSHTLLFCRFVLTWTDHHEGNIDCSFLNFLSEKNTLNQLLIKIVDNYFFFVTSVSVDDNKRCSGLIGH